MRKDTYWMDRAPGIPGTPRAACHRAPGNLSPMRRSPRHRVRPVPVIFLVVAVACSGSGGSTSTTSQVTTTTLGPPTTTTTSPTSTTTVGTTTSPTTTASRGLEIVIDFFDGQVAGPGRVEIERGEVVVLLVAADVADEVHLHGYDLRADVSPDQAAMIEFTADIPGIFELELEDGHTLLAELEVRP